MVSLSSRPNMSSEIRARSDAVVRSTSNDASRSLAPPWPGAKARRIERLPCAQTCRRVRKLLRSSPTCMLPCRRSSSTKVGGRDASTSPPGALPKSLTPTKPARPPCCNEEMSRLSRPITT